MTTAATRALYWTPRVLGILFAAFLSVFSFDVFGEERGLWQMILALLVHLIPVFAVVLVLVVAWRWEWVGAVAFTALAVLYVLSFWGRFPLLTYCIICGPLIVAAGLFLFNWIHRAELRA